MMAYGGAGTGGALGGYGSYGYNLQPMTIMTA
jgi:hypothetical protein